MKRSQAKPPAGGSEPLLSIGDVAAITGVSAETLRMWERRYGRPEAVRLPSGHRRYTQEHVRWLRRVAEALARGHRPHKVVRLDEADLDALLAPEEGAEDHEETIAELFEHVRNLDTKRLSDALERGWSADDAQAWLEERVAPLIRAVGRAWADGDLEIRHEHFVSEVVADVLRSLRRTFPISPEVPRVLLTTLPGETHGLGLQMAALLCAAHRVPTWMLGVNTPAEEIAEAARALGVEMVGISVSLATGGVETDRALAGLRGMLPDGVRLVVGGEGARGVRRGPRGVEYADGLGGWIELLHSLDQAA
jgi:DNA-binding transcriptional MerR regulator/methylmalonyl-CoA mutase cobalamin-binding subunit